MWSRWHSLPRTNRGSHASTTMKSSQYLHLWHQLGSRVDCGAGKSHVSGTRLGCHACLYILIECPYLDAWYPRDRALPVVCVTDYIPKVYGIRLCSFIQAQENFYHSQRLFEVDSNHKFLHSTTFCAPWIILQQLFNCLLCERGTQSSAVSREGGVCV